ncbi:SMI1/KNR4 family protein [Amycolatopsis rhabdoformis]|uniref:SMI1/KNR4 family protein n=1 Tax=Amycolatopsis rhabdoformis TaxID=1448059 RepID=A0ABZ1HZA9_9PSEU|nr:SMI1/KNR4 family protein [Amycolatopsis rhabdoformis]WSE27290.1 SMI1/KNR4 family protein [Amycolatopsis rhabdoformis]
MSLFQGSRGFVSNLIGAAERALGVRLPRSYLDALASGAVLDGRRCPTPFPTSWAADHFEVAALLGIGGPDGIDGEFGSAYLVEEWEYPDIGVVICQTPSGGHDIVMLDYTACGPTGEPFVAFIDEDRVPRRVAGSFAEFLAKLE